MSRKPQTRYPHAFSKGRGPGFHSQGSWRTARTVELAMRPGMTAQAAKAAKPLYPMTLDPRRWKYLKVSPTVANLYKGHMGVAVVCADCLHGVAHRNPGLPDLFKRQWHLTLIELEQRCRCEMCGSKNARVYPWFGDAASAAESILAAAAPPDLRPLYDDQLRMLGELAELGLDAARAVVRQANAEAPPPASATALAYARVSRAVRLCIMLQSKLIEAKDEEEELQEMFTPRYGRKARVERIVDRVAADQCRTEEHYDAVIAEMGERLDDEDLYGDLMERPLADIVDRLCHDLGLEPDWAELSQELWAKREALTSPDAVASAGGVSSVAANDLAAMRTPAACCGPEAAEERVVEGESQAHHPSSLALTDSS